MEEIINKMENRNLNNKGCLTKNSNISISFYENLIFEFCKKHCRKN